MVPALIVKSRRRCPLPSSLDIDVLGRQVKESLSLTVNSRHRWPSRTSQQDVTGRHGKIKTSLALTDKSILMRYCYAKMSLALVRGSDSNLSADERWVLPHFSYAVGLRGQGLDVVGLIYPAGEGYTTTNHVHHGNSCRYLHAVALALVGR